MKKIRRFFRGFRYGQRGFTLIELLVVIGILAIIAAIVVPNFSNFFQRGQTEADEMEHAMVKTATMAYLAETGTCPSAIGDLASYFENPGDVRCSYSWDASCTCSQDSCP